MKRVALSQPLIDNLVNVAILLTCAVVVAMVLQRSATTGTRAPLRETAAPFRVGEAAGSLPSVDWGAADRTLVMYVRSTCGYRVASATFYRDLTNALISRPWPRIRVVAAGPESAQLLQNYLNDHRIRVDAIAAGVGELVPTPTLTLVDRRGLVTRVWVGEQSATGEAQIRGSVLPER